MFRVSLIVCFMMSAVFGPMLCCCAFGKVCITTRTESACNGTTAKHLCCACGAETPADPATPAKPCECPADCPLKWPLDCTAVERSVSEPIFVSSLWSAEFDPFAMASTTSFEADRSLQLLRTAFADPFVTTSGLLHSHHRLRC